MGSSPWTDPPTQVTSAAYDARNQRVSLTDAAAGSTTTYDPDHNYAPAARYRATAAGREQQTLYAYDARHRLTSIGFQTCAANSSHACTKSPVSSGSDTYAYDEADNRGQVGESNGSASSDRRYCYDGSVDVPTLYALALSTDESLGGRSVRARPVEWSDVPTGTRGFALRSSAQSRGRVLPRSKARSGRWCRRR